MKNKKKNPLNKRILRELAGDFKKYLVVGFVLILTIGFVSGMYVANDSMEQAMEDGHSTNKLEDGHFELQNRANSELIAAIETGEKTDLHLYYLEKARKELDDKFEEEFRREFDEQFEAQIKSNFLAHGLDETITEQLLQETFEQTKKTEEYQAKYNEAYEKAYAQAWQELENEVNNEYADAEKRYELNDSEFAETKATVYEQFYRNEAEDHDNDGESDGTIRVYIKSDQVNLASVLEGRLPKNEQEIAIDRMHADNAGLKVGDSISVGGNTYQITGLIAYVNYSTLYEKNTDMMFDALKFDVAMVTEGGFERLSSRVHYNYAWLYENKPANVAQEKKMSDDFLKALMTQCVTAENELEDYLPTYENQAVQFAPEDMGSDKAMGGVLLYILTGVIAFIFAITITNTITKEASVIGTLRASGYSRGELVRHYLSIPVIVTIIAALVGNVLGYTVFKNIVVRIYYNSYSLPAYKTIWNGDAFVRTTLIPLIIMIVVNLLIIVRKMHYTPLQFLRHDFKKNKRKKTIRLPRWKFLSRFRLRIMFQNIPNYLILFVGVLFVSIMLAMAVGMPDTLSYYKQNISDLVVSKYQYVLKSYETEDGIVSTKTGGAEIFSLKSLVYKTDSLDESVSVYGIEKNSRYVEIPDLNGLTNNEVYITKSFEEKYGYRVGDMISLDEKYENKEYQLKVVGIYQDCQAIAVFMPVTEFNQMFAQEPEAFSGFLSNKEITDLDTDNIATIITERDFTKIADQLDHSMGATMTYFQYLCILLSAALIYLLTKIIIEKNEKAISMTKVLGYTDREIAGLYIFSTTIVLLVSDVLSVWIGSIIMKEVWKTMMQSYSGWFGFVMSASGYIKMFAFVLIGYLLVVVLDFKRIKKIPMDEALKNIE